MGCNASSPKGIKTESAEETAPAKVNLEAEKSALNSDTGDCASTVGMEVRGDMFQVDDGRMHESKLSVAANDIVARVAEEVEDDRHLVQKVDDGRTGHVPLNCLDSELKQGTSSKSSKTRESDGHVRESNAGGNIPRISSGGDALSLDTAAVKIADIASTEELSRSIDPSDGKQHPDYVFKLLLVCDKRAALSSLLQWFVESDANFEQQHTKGSKASISASGSGERRSPTKVKGRMPQKSDRQKASPQQKNANSSSSDGVEFKFRTIKVEDKFVRLQLWDVDATSDSTDCQVILQGS